ncbi:PAS domain-containing protein [Deinococcus enclensis]|uniref:histidine kinase n=1 Tax=Deinococcus enclensis TaxID=1049582 RepID=A0ABT9MHY1_9DEIO|nr:PAS domain-containing protein [Deinococcus enclensis]MDP9766197.1 PAS domain S-box-containing protein [Deinococcus enclensis]
MPSPSATASPDLLLLITGQLGAAAVGEALTALREERPATLLIALDERSAEFLREALGSELHWATPGTVLMPGPLYVARPEVLVEARDAGLTVTPLSAHTTALPLDALLGSVAQAVGARSLTVILGPADGAWGSGLNALSVAGGTVLHAAPTAAGWRQALGLLLRPGPHRQDGAAAQAADILERMGDAHCLLDREFRIRSVNAAAERLLGMPRAQLLGRSHWEAFPASVDAPIGRALRRVVQDGTEQHLTHHYTGEGYDLHLEVDAYPTGAGGVSMFWRDITERVRAETALRDSEEKYRALFTEMDEAYAVVEVLADGAGRWVDFLFLDANPPFMRHTGMPYPVGRTATELLGTPNPRWAELYGQVAESGVPLRVQEGELTLGKVFDLNIFRLGGPDSRRVAVLFTDITERRQAQQAHEVSERQYRLLFENMVDGFALAEMIWDERGQPTDWRYLEVNGAWVQTGVAVADTVGRTAREVNPGIEPGWLETYGRVVQTGQPVRYEAYAAGFGKWFDTVAFRHSENRFGLVFRDVTERRQTEAALREDEERQAFLLRLSDALRPLSGSAEIERAAVHLLGQEMGVNRVFYASVDPGGESWSVQHDYAHRVPSCAGAYPMSAFQRARLAQWTSGKVSSVADCATDPSLSAEDRAAYAAFDTRAAIGVPLVKGGRFVALLSVNHSAPRAWTSSELTLAREVAERTWAAIERARAEEALRDNRQQLQLITDAIPALIAHIDSGLHYRFVNRQFETWFGRAPADLIGTHVRTVLGEAAFELVQPHAQAALAGQPQSFEMDVPFEAGGTRHVQFEFIPDVKPDGSVTGFSALATDITERRRAEVALRERQDRQAFLLRLSDALRPLADAEAVEATACRLLGAHLNTDRAYFVEVNEAAGTASVTRDWVRNGAPSLAGQHRVSDFGWSVEILRRGECHVISDTQRSALVPEPDRPASAALGIIACMGAPLIKAGQLVGALCVTEAHPREWTEQEVDLLRDVGERIWAAVERARAEAARRDSETRLRTLIEQLPGGAVFIVDRDLTYVLAEGEALIAAGFTPQDLTGRSVADAMAPDLVESYLNTYRRALAGEGFEREHAAHGRVYLTRGIPLRNAAGEISSVLAVSYDITDRKRAEEQVRAVNLTLEARVTERTRRLTALNAELMARTRALEGFSVLTRDLGLEADRGTVIRRAQDLVMSLLPEGFAAYYEPEGAVWRKVTQVGDTRNPALQALMDAGLPLDSPSFIHPFRSGQPEYQEAYVPGTDTRADVAEHVHSTAALPVRVGGAPVGLFAIVQFEARTWSPADRALLETVVQHLNLALDRAEAVRRLSEEREALSAFARFTELAARTSDVRLLAQQAAEVLHQVLEVDFAVYFEREGEVWKGRASAGDLTLPVQRLMGEGVPTHMTSFLMSAARREPMFFDHWHAGHSGVPELGGVQALAVFPLFPQDHPAGVLGAVKVQSPIWRDRERAVFQGVGEAFRLALERTAQMQQIDRQRGRLADLNAELGTLITRTAHQLDVPARHLDTLLSPGEPDLNAALDRLPSLDPAALHDEIRRLRAVAQDLRGLSVLEGQPLDTDLLALGELVDEVRREVGLTKPEVTWFTEPLPIVRGDRALLRQALNVLMTFVLSPTRGARYVTVSSREAEGEVRVLIEDDGVGLSGEEAATLFDLAVRTDQEVPLMEGGGLMQVRRILARHGGWAWAESRSCGGKVVLAFPQEAAAGELDALLLGDGPRP